MASPDRQALESAASFSQPRMKRMSGGNVKSVPSGGGTGDRPLSRSTGTGNRGQVGSVNLSTFGIRQRPQSSPVSFGSGGNTGGQMAPASGGTAGGNTAPPGMPGANDPAFLAYLRQFGIDESMVNIMSAHNISKLERELGRALPMYAERRSNAIRDTGAGYESSGLFRSGSRIVGQAEAARGVDRERDEFQARIYDQIRDEVLQAMNQVAALRRELLEQGYDSVTATAIANAQAGIY